MHEDGGNLEVSGAQPFCMRKFVRRYTRVVVGLKFMDSLLWRAFESRSTMGQSLMLLDVPINLTT